MEKDGRVLIIKRIHVNYFLAEVDSDEDRETVQRALGFHAEYCPIARSISPPIEITTSLEYI